jgi:hypothetical protein
VLVPFGGGDHGSFGRGFNQRRTGRGVTVRSGRLTAHATSGVGRTSLRAASQDALGAERVPQVIPVGHHLDAEVVDVVQPGTPPVPGAP